MYLLRQTRQTPLVFCPSVLNYVRTYKASPRKKKSYGELFSRKTRQDYSIDFKLPLPMVNEAVRPLAEMLRTAPVYQHFRPLVDGALHAARRSRNQKVQA